MKHRFKLGDKVVINTKSNDLSSMNGTLSEIVEILPESNANNYVIKYKSKSGIRNIEIKARDNELQEIKNNEILQLEHGQEITYVPTGESATVEQIDLLHGMIGIRFKDNSFGVYGIETLRVNKSHVRKSWDEYFMDISEKVATRATCDRLHVGCVIVKNKKIVSTGYNGSVFGESHCDEVGHLYNDQNRCVRTIHAEQNAILYANRDELKGATAYVTHQPCENCAKLLVQSGVKKVVYLHKYDNKYSNYFLDMIESVHLKGDE